MGMHFGVHRSCHRPFRTSLRPHVEVMEDRLLLTTFTVSNTLDDTNPGSLRYAITQSNSTPGPNLITFAIPGTGVHTISPTTTLPPITAPVSIDGYSQTGASRNSNMLSDGDNAVLNIVLSGPGVDPHSQAAGLEIDARDVTVQGLVINKFYLYVIIYNYFNKILIQGNFIGTGAAGKNALGNASYGVDVHGDNNTIGGTADGARNVIPGNGNNGVLIGSRNTAVQGNYVGIDATDKNPLFNFGNGVLIVPGADGSTNGHVGRLLRASGRTPQVPIRRAIQRDEEAIRCGREETRPTLQQQAWRERRVRVFGDEPGFYLLPGVVRAYAPEGLTPVLREEVTRDHLSVMGGMTPTGKVSPLVRQESLNGWHSVEFLLHLGRVAGERLLVIWDDAPTHRRAEVKEFVSRTRDGVWLESLPGSAPDLNPWDEGGWPHLKNVERHNQVCRDLEELHPQFHPAIGRRRLKPRSVRAFFAQAGLMIEKT